jgi:hypothetical protein
MLHSVDDLAHKLRAERVEDAPEEGTTCLSATIKVVRPVRLEAGHLGCSWQHPLQRELRYLADDEVTDLTVLQHSLLATDYLLKELEPALLKGRKVELLHGVWLRESRKALTNIYVM